jgi:hypothetical protein
VGGASIRSCTFTKPSALLSALQVALGFGSPLSSIKGIVGISEILWMSEILWIWILNGS